MLLLGFGVWGAMEYRQGSLSPCGSINLLVFFMATYYDMFVALHRTFSICTLLEVQSLCAVPVSP